jgi:hypothetical protein
MTNRGCSLEDGFENREPIIFFGKSRGELAGLQQGLEVLLEKRRKTSLRKTLQYLFLMMVLVPEFDQASYRLMHRGWYISSANWCTTCLQKTVSTQSTASASKRLRDPSVRCLRPSSRRTLSSPKMKMRKPSSSPWPPSPCAFASLSTSSTQPTYSRPLNTIGRGKGF